MAGVFLEVFTLRNVFVNIILHDFKNNILTSTICKRTNVTYFNNSVFNRNTLVLSGFVHKCYMRDVESFSFYLFQCLRGEHKNNKIINYGVFLFLILE